MVITGDFLYQVYDPEALSIFWKKQARFLFHSSYAQYLVKKAIKPLFVLVEVY